MMRVFGLALALVVLAGCYITARVPRPRGEPLAIAPGQFPHDALTAVTSSVVDVRGMVDYAGLRKDRVLLEKYLAALAATSPHQDPQSFPSRAHRLAYYLNAYNATVLYSVTQRPAMRSVSEELKGFFFFTKHRYGDELLTLQQLEDEVIRERFADARVHFALNWATVGSPPLAREAFLPEKLEEQLDERARSFCADPNKVRFEGNVVLMSELFAFYEDDFVVHGGPLAFCKRFGRVDLPEVAEVKLIPWDWTLNARLTK